MFTVIFAFDFLFLEFVLLPISILLFELFLCGINVKLMKKMALKSAFWQLEDYLHFVKCGQRLSTTRQNWEQN